MPTLPRMNTDKRFATFLRDLSASLKVDHYPLAPSAKIIDAYADELDPAAVVVAAPLSTHQTRDVPEVSPVHVPTPPPLPEPLPSYTMTADEQASANASTRHAPRAEKHTHR